jgi:phosphohistidine phosphatase
LRVDSTAEIITKQIVDNDSSKTILIIGHQPNLGLVITRLLGMNESACAVKKGAVWWLRQRNVDGVMQTYLFTVQHPDY